MFQFVCKILFCLILFLTTAYAGELNLDFEQANMADVIRFIAASYQKDIILSPSVTGMVTLHLQHISAEQALNIVLTTHGLEQLQLGRVTFIAPRAELMQRAVELLQWQEKNLETLPQTSFITQIHYAKAEDIAHIIQDDKFSLLTKRGKLRIDARTNTLYIEDTLSQLQQVRKLIHRLDIPVQQITIAVSLVSIDTDYLRELGLNFTNTASREVGKFTLALVKLAHHSLLEVKLSALENAGHAEVISNPRLYTANQQTAYIEAGEEVPYQEMSLSGGTAVVFKKAVLGLKVTPQILPDNKVLLQLQVNQDRPNNQLVLGMPTISTRQIVTQVLACNRQTIVLGGIYESNHEQSELRIPFMSRLPVIGMLFKQRNTRINKRELLIFVTPMISV